MDRIEMVKRLGEAKILRIKMVSMNMDTSGIDAQIEGWLKLIEATK